LFLKVREGKQKRSDTLEYCIGFGIGVHWTVKTPNLKSNYLHFVSFVVYFVVSFVVAYFVVSLLFIFRYYIYYYYYYYTFSNEIDWIDSGMDLLQSYKMIENTKQR